ncbi:MAG: TFIIB-type zinc ribbon-containing protein, partial [Thermoplasmata archaeon]
MQKKNIEEHVVVCPECGSTHLIRDYERGELICQDCGLVIDDSYIDQGPEWRAFDAEQDDKRARTGAPINYLTHDKGLATEISWSNKDSYGKRIPHRNRAQIYRVRKWHQRIRVSNSAERNLSVALQEMKNITIKMKLPKDVEETAAVIYRKAVFKNLIRGR